MVRSVCAYMIRPADSEGYFGNTTEGALRYLA